MKHPAVPALCGILFFSLAMIVIAQPQESSPTMKTVLTGVINQQLSAFRANDYARAYSFASSDLRRMYPVANFTQMVQNGFPQIAHSTTNDFGVALDDGEDGVVFVRVGDARGNRMVYRYTLHLEQDGWKITGVTPADFPKPSAPDSPYMTKL